MIPTVIWQSIIAPMMVFALVVLIGKAIFDAVQAYRNFRDLENIQTKDEEEK